MIKGFHGPREARASAWRLYSLAGSRHPCSRKPRRRFIFSMTGLTQSKPARVREFIQGMIEGELERRLSRPRYAPLPEAPHANAGGPSSISGHRHGHRSRSLMGTFGRVEIAMPRARLDIADGRTTEWKSKALWAYELRTRHADVLIAGIP